MVNNFTNINKWTITSHLKCMCLLWKFCTTCISTKLKIQLEAHRSLYSLVTKLWISNLSFNYHPQCVNNKVCAFWEDTLTFLNWVLLNIFPSWWLFLIIFINMKENINFVENRLGYLISTTIYTYKKNNTPSHDYCKIVCI